jgi:hypothetical protein
MDICREARDEDSNVDYKAFYGFGTAAKVVAIASKR